MDSLAVSLDADAQTKPIDSGTVLLEQVPGLARYPNFLRRFLVFALQWLICEDRINAFLSEHALARDFDFVDQVFQHLQTDCKVLYSDLENIPTHGRVIIVANHPLGGLDGLALLRLVSRVRRDVRIVATQQSAREWLAGWTWLAGWLAGCCGGCEKGGATAAEC